MNGNDADQPKAVIYPSRTVAGYGHIYSLGIAGIPVVALHPHRGFAFYSRFLTERHVVPDAENDPAGFVDWLVEYGGRQRTRPVLFMAEDLYAYIAYANCGRLAPLYRYPYIPADVAAALFDKQAMYRSAESAGLNVPPTLCAPSGQDWQVGWKHFPAVIKPLVSRFRLEGGEIRQAPSFPKIFGSKALMVASPEELATVISRIERHGFEFCIQKYVAGDNPLIYNVKFVTAPDSSIPACFISRKVRQQPADFGTCCVSASQYVPELQEQAERFCRVVGYVGPGGMEFKLDPADGRFWFIEVNPRLDFWVRMSTLKGVNLPLQQYLLSLGEPLHLVRQRDDGTAWIDIEGDIRGYRWLRSRGQGLALRDFLRPYRSFDEAVWNLRDPLPGLLNFARMGPSLLRR